MSDDQSPPHQSVQIRDLAVGESFSRSIRTPLDEYDADNSAYHNMRVSVNGTVSRIRRNGSKPTYVVEGSRNLNHECTAVIETVCVTRLT